MDKKQFSNYPQNIKGLTALFIDESLRIAELYAPKEPKKARNDFLTQAKAQTKAVCNSPELVRNLERLGAVAGERVNFQTLKALCLYQLTNRNVLGLGGFTIFPETLKAVCRWCDHCEGWGAFDERIKQDFFLDFRTHPPKGKMKKLFGYFGIETPRQVERLGNALFSLAITNPDNIETERLMKRTPEYRAFFLLYCSKSFFDICEPLGPKPKPKARGAKC